MAPEQNNIQNTGYYSISMRAVDTWLQNKLSNIELNKPWYSELNKAVKSTHVLQCWSHHKSFSTTIHAPVPEYTEKQTERKTASLVIILKYSVDYSHLPMGIRKMYQLL